VDSLLSHLGFGSGVPTVFASEGGASSNAIGLVLLFNLGEYLELRLRYLLAEASSISSCINAKDNVVSTVLGL
jgi:hypothetical protein